METNMPELTTENDVYLLDLGDGENRFTPEWIAQVGDSLDEVTNAQGKRALLTVATGKFWSNGLDLDWLSAHSGELESYVASVHGLFARLLRLTAPSIAVLQGHAFAAGAMLALAHDTRIMRADRGYFCLPEVTIGIPFTTGMGALIQARVSHQTAHEAMTTGRRYDSDEALAAGIIAAALAEEDLLPAAMDMARQLAPNAGATLATIRSQMYTAVLGHLEPD
jgi:enoyl-CoA hydratase/carnithine racemase